MRRESRNMGRVSGEGGNLLLSSTVHLPLESKDNLYYTTDVYYNDVNATCTVIGYAHDLLDYRAIQRTWMMSQETCFFCCCCFIQHMAHSFEMFVRLFNNNLVAKGDVKISE